MTSYFYFKIVLSGEGLRALYLWVKQNMNLTNSSYITAINDAINVLYLYIYFD